MIFFGYGSLINEISLRKTVPSAKILGLAILKGYRRYFGIPSTSRLSQGNSISVLNIEKSENFLVNGICFEVDEKEKLLQREKGYELVEILVQCQGKTVKAFTFISQKEPKDFLRNNRVQKEYLDICLEGGKEISNDFYEDFLENTFINDMPLKKISF